MKLLKSENLNLFLPVFILTFISAYFVNFKLNLIFGDALVRSFHAYLIFFGNQPKISAVGFVWPPLQTLLQLPLVLIQPLNTHGFAGNVLTAIFLGLCTVYLNLIGKFFKVSKVIRYISLALFVTNPIIFFYGSNGMSEIVGITFILMTLYYFLKHISTKSIPALILSSLSLACTFMTRWEMGTLMVTSLILIASLVLFKKKYTLAQAESSAVMFATPVLYALFLWLLASWLIVGSPTYFLNSTYSFTPQDAKNLASDTVLSHAKLNILATAQYTLTRIASLSLLLIPLFLLTFKKLFQKQNRLYALTLLGFGSTVILSQIMPIFLGKSYGQLRYFIYAIPFTYIYLMFLFKDSAKDLIHKNFNYFAFTLISAGLILSSFFSFFAMNAFGNQEESTLTRLIIQKNLTHTNEVFNHEQEIASYIMSHVQPRSILVDDSLGFNIVYLTQNPHLFIERVDKEFDATLKDPVNSNAEFMLITDPEDASGVDTVSLAYPKMFREGAPFVKLEKDFGSWRLYRIIKHTS